MTSILPGSFSVEPLQEQHRRAGFTSGAAELDRYFEIQIGQDAKRKVAAPFVLLEAGGAVIGYYTLSAHGIRIAELPPETAKKLPRYPVLPATLLGRLAIDRSQQGKKLGQFLLMDALRRSWENTREIGSVGVLVDAYDESAERFYRHHEFTPLPGHSRRLFLPMTVVKTLFAD